MPNRQPAHREAEILSMLRFLFAAESARLHGARVVLFGSRAKGTARPRSDFDVGVLGESPMPLADFYALADAIEALSTLHTIDWVDLMRAEPRFRAAALETHAVLHVP